MCKISSVSALIKMKTILVTSFYWNHGIWLKHNLFAKKLQTYTKCWHNDQKLLKNRYLWHLAGCMLTDLVRVGVCTTTQIKATDVWIAWTRWHHWNRSSRPKALLLNLLPWWEAAKCPKINNINFIANTFTKFEWIIFYSFYILLFLLFNKS